MGSVDGASDFAPPDSCSDKDGNRRRALQKAVEFALIPVPRNMSHQTEGKDGNTHKDGR